MIIIKDLIDLQSAYIKQTSDAKGKGAWRVHKNMTYELLGELPASLTEANVFDVMRFARKYELIAFNAGINFQKDNQNQSFIEQIAILKSDILGLQQHNNLLATEIERLTLKEV